MRMPGRPVFWSGTGLPGGVKMQNSPASRDIKWPDTFNSRIDFGPGPAWTGPEGAGAAALVLVSLTVECLASQLIWSAWCCPATVIGSDRADGQGLWSVIV